jgi:hypothetical protein
MRQSGSGGRDAFFNGPAYQRGRGLGGLFGKIFRAAVPLLKGTVAPMLKTGAKAVAKEALRTGVGVAGDMLEGGSGVESFKLRGKAGARRLAQQGVRKMEKMFNDAPAKRRRVRSRGGKTIKGRGDIYTR